MDKIYYGCLRKVDTTTNQAVDLFTYGDILFNLSMRRQLYTELESCNKTKLFCSCCIENMAEIKINSSYELTFPNITYHTRECFNYIKELVSYMIHPSVAPFAGQTNYLPVSFRWQKRAKSYASFIRNRTLFQIDGPLSLDQVTAIINIRAFRDVYRQTHHITVNQHHISNVLFEFGRYILKAPDNTSMQLTQQYLFRPQQGPGTISFIYAQVVEINNTYKTMVYLICDYGASQCSICVERSKWDSYISDYLIPGLPLYISGFIVTQEVTAYKPGRYDSKTFRYYNEGATDKRKQHKLKTFVAFHSNELGLICFSKEEYEYGNSLSSNKIHYQKPYYPTAGQVAIPLLQFYSNATTIKNYPEDFNETIE